MTKEVLQGLIDQRLSTRKIAKKLGCSQTNIHYLLVKYGLKTLCRPGPKGHLTRNSCGNCGKIVSECRKLYCNGKCRQEHLYNSFIEEWRRTGELVLSKDFCVPGAIRKYLFLKYGGRCCLCGWNKVNVSTKKPPLEIDHIDGCWRNNREDNFQLLCPNCHSLTPTYKALNIGKGRPRPRYMKVAP